MSRALTRDLIARISVTCAVGLLIVLVGMITRPPVPDIDLLQRSLNEAIRTAKTDPAAIQTSSRAKQKDSNHVPGELLIRFNDTDRSAIEAALEPLPVDVVEYLGGIDTYVLKLPAAVDIPRLAADLDKIGIVDYAEPNLIYESLVTPDDPNYGAQWALSKIGAAAAWDRTLGDSSVVVAVVDTGLDLNHEDISDRVWTNSAEASGAPGVDDDGNGKIDDLQGWDFVSVSATAVAGGEDPGPEDNDVSDVHGHGTHVSGIIGADTNNGLGIAGLDWQSKIMPLRAGYKTPSGGGALEVVDIVNALDYAVLMNANVINMSFGDTAPSAAIQSACDSATAAGVVLVAAAGNDGNSTEYFPAALPNVIAVGATDINDNLAGFSNYGSWVSVVAPGNSILSTLPGDSYGAWNGTSMAAPYVSGLIALMLSVDASATPDDIKTRLETTSDDLGAPGPDNTFGNGRINALRAVNNAPVAVSGGPFERSVGESLTLDATASFDPDGDSLTYAWDWGDNGSDDVSETANNSPTISWADMVNFGAAYPADPDTGLPTNELRLTVTDSLGASDEVTTTVTIYGTEPVARASANPQSAACNQTVSFDGSASYHQNPSRTIIQYEWDFGDGDSGVSGDTTSHAYDSFGTYLATLTVTDDNGGTAAVELNIDVDQGNGAPSADPGGPYVIDEGDALVLDGTGSTEPDADCGDSIAYGWDLDDNDDFDDAFGATPTISPATLESLGITQTADPQTGLPAYTVKLRVTDSFGSSDAAQTTVTVVDNEPPITSFETSPSSPNGDNDWFITLPEVKLSRDVTGTTRYSLNGGPWATDSFFDITFEIDLEGINDVEYFSIDGAGNREATKTQEVKVDTDDPTSPTVSGFARLAGLDMFWTPSTDTVGLGGYRIYNDCPDGSGTVLLDTFGTGETSTQISWAQLQSPPCTQFVGGFDLAGRESLSNELSFNDDSGNGDNTPAGPSVEPVTVGPDPNVSITFADVVSDGSTTVQQTTEPTETAGLPANFSFMGTLYDISTDASYTPPIEVSFQYDESVLTIPEDQLKIYHFDGVSWEDVTKSRDAVNNVITGEISHFSILGMGGGPPPSTGLNTAFLIAFSFLLVAGGLGSRRLSSRPSYPKES